MKNIIFIAFLFFSTMILGQETVQLKGFVKNSKTKEGIPDVKVTIDYPANLGTAITDQNGRFIIENAKLSIQRIEISCSHENFQANEFKSNINSIASIGPFYLDPILDEIGINFKVCNEDNKTVKGVKFTSNITGSKIHEIGNNGRYFFKLDKKYLNKPIKCNFYVEGNAYLDEPINIILKDYHFVKVILKKNYTDEFSKYPIPIGYEKDIPSVLTSKVSNLIDLMDDFVKAENMINNTDLATSKSIIEKSSLFSFVYDESKIIHLQNVVKDSTITFNILYKSFTSAYKTNNINDFTKEKELLLQTTSNLLKLYSILLETYDRLLENIIAKNDSDYIFTIRNNRDSIFSNLKQYKSYYAKIKQIYIK